MPNPSELARVEEEERAADATGFEDYTDLYLAQALRQQSWKSAANEEAARRLEKSND